METETIDALLQAFLRLQQIGSDLYDASEAAFGRGSLSDASGLVSQADKIYQEAENLEGASTFGGSTFLNQPYSKLSGAE